MNAIKEEKSLLKFYLKRLNDCYYSYENSIKISIYLWILGGRLNKTNGEVVFYDELLKKETHSLEKNNKTTVNFDFQFNYNQKRRLDEYDDLYVYINNKQNYLITTTDEKEMIEEINFGIIDNNNVDSLQITSSNIWISVLDKNLSHITNQKLDLSYFENQNYHFFMNLNEKFFFQVNDFKKFQQKKYPDLPENAINALEKIVFVDEKFTKLKKNVIILNLSRKIQNFLLN